MLHRIALAAVATGAAIALSALPATAATAPASSHHFAAPSIPGASGWGDYTKTAGKVRLWLCAKDTKRDGLGAVTSAAFTDRSGRRYQNAITYNFKGYGHTVCKTFTSKLTGHLDVMVAVGTRSQPVRFSDPERVY